MHRSHRAKVNSAAFSNHSTLVIEIIVTILASILIIRRRGERSLLLLVRVEAVFVKRAALVYDSFLTVKHLLRVHHSLVFIHSHLLPLFALLQKGVQCLLSDSLRIQGLRSCASFYLTLESAGKVF